MTAPSPRPKLTRPRPAVAQPARKAAPTGAGVRRPVAERIAPKDALLICFYKPYGVLSQFTPEGKWQGLKDYIDLPGVYVAGRLDADSEGLLLLTNDGTLQARIADPRHKLAKTYWVQVEGHPTEEQLRRLREGVALRDGTTLPARHVVLAVGHSARDTFTAIHDAGIHIEAKPFAIGVRIEHPQGWIDKARYGQFAGHPVLGPAAYALAHQASNGRAVYAFCMCPGGKVVAAASEPGRVVTNGMSQYSRAEFNANSGLVVDIAPERDYPGGPLAGVAFQRQWEEAAFRAGGGDYCAPAQLVGDFLAGRASTALGSVTPSYQPGVRPTDITQCLPEFVSEALREALPVFGRQIAGYDHAEAVMTAVESRTSSPVRIRRGADLQSVNTSGLYPAGEGAGYAGGILSAAVDGIRVAEALAADLLG